ncbi:MAG TPA: UDP-N-acetylmuramate dehydrogenase [Candidatus Woesebacteria bacterium]|nr:UDP-N-acetylmuramate dehydrogenase [Candidatus Woesebacteria bacterium]
MQKLIEHFGDRLKQNKDLSPYFTLKTKTVAQCYLEAESKEDIVNAISITSQENIPLFLLGGGSNTAVLSDIIQGLVLRNMYKRKEIIQETSEYADVLFSSGYMMSLVVRVTVQAGLSGFEYHLGLPGTLGGAIYMNSKWTKNLAYAGDNLISAQIVDTEGNEKTVNRDYFEFAYDYSILQKTGELFLEGVFRLQKEDTEVLQDRAENAQAYRKQTQPFGVATGGCFFQNITDAEKERLNLPTKSAGYLVDKAGLKGFQIGAFQVSDIHANFIINTGDGKPEDLQKMLHHIKSTVKEKFGVDLKEEVVVKQ